MPPVRTKLAWKRPFRTRLLFAYVVLPVLLTALLFPSVKYVLFSKDLSIEREIHHKQNASLGNSYGYNATAFVCITGQVKRLVGTAIQDTILDPLRQQGYRVDVAIVLSDDELYSTNVKGDSTWRWSQFQSFPEAVAFFSSSGFHVVTTSPIVQLKEPPIPFNYLLRMDKTYMSNDWQRGRVENHARQWETLTKCRDAMINANTDNNAVGKQRNETLRYDITIRIREDVSLLEPIRMNDITPFLYPNGVDAANGTIIGTDCRTHGGINDRMAIVSWNAIHDYFSGPWKYFTQVDSDLHSASIKVNNPESFLRYVYRDRLNMTVIQTSKLRGVTKFVVRNKGSQEQPNITVEPASGEIKRSLCPD